jgi:DNA-binding HxlR family transcriptional regulator/putative sterol carrier protein
MATTRTYGDSCGIARALDVVGERWALLVVRELLLGPKRFTDLRDGLPRVGPDILSQRLRQLEQAGVLGRRKLAPPAGAQVYELTDRGRELEPIVLGLGRWGSRVPMPPGDPELGVDSAMLALKTLFDVHAAEGLEASYELRLGEHRFHARVADGRLSLDRGDADRPDATIESDPNTLATLLWEGRRLTEAVRSGDVKVEGNRPALTRFLGLFPLPV